ncbi:catechol 2,3-dioxygenase [Paraburkholderia sp. CNPSo 3157]|uniref:Metapyrocatechase n=1 Tax=Paraburkholderia franconis TaxID=2654983 RepID=A0A7X1TKU1_9BURK|nr:catechol 2,3-dioxygenase [Paraburkholderia franconis]MPW22931.1 catechol 2,3-dioxygenase [Paraburkholderia franconis]
MALQGVLRPGHIALRVLELEPAVRHYTEVLGLHETGRDAKGRVYLKAWDEHDHHSVVLREADEPGMDYIGFRVDGPATLDRLANAVKDSGLVSDCKWIEAGEHLQTGMRFRFTVSTGHAIELFAHKEKIGTATGDVNPDPWPDGLRGMSPSRFDHCLLYGDGFDDTVKLFREVLGFSLTEQVVTPDGLQIAAFLTCSNKAHDIAFIRHGEKNKFHHASFVLDSWGDVLKAADLISKHDVALDIGPTRHGITRGATIYFFDPSGNRNEVFAGGYIHYPDKPVITWHEKDLGRAIFYHDRKLNDAFLTVLT